MPKPASASPWQRVIAWFGLALAVLAPIGYVLIVYLDAVTARSGSDERRLIDTLTGIVIISLLVVLATVLAAISVIVNRRGIIGWIAMCLSGAELLFVAWLFIALSTMHF